MAFDTGRDRAALVVVDLRSVVTTGITNLAASRSRDRAEKESAFQRSVLDNGLSYEDQIEFRKKQIEDEKNRESIDSEYVRELESDLSDIRSLKKFQEIREDYLSSYEDLVTGKGNLKQHKKFLEQVLEDNSNEEIQSQYREELATTIAAIESSEVATLNNRISLAEKDGSISLINKTIKDVKKKKSFAELNGNDEEASKWDISLQSLTQRKAEVQIQNSLHDLTFNAEQGEATSATGKLNELDKLVSKADGGSAVTINGVGYESERAYWESVRGDYVSGNGSIRGYETFFGELESEVKDKVDTVILKTPFGMTPVATLDGIKNTYDNLAKKDYLANYADQFESSRTVALGYGVSKAANAIQSSSIAEVNVTAGLAALDQLQSSYGINLEGAKFALNEEFVTIGSSLPGRANAAENLARAGIDTPDATPAPSPSELLNLNAPGGAFTPVTFDRKADDKTNLGQLMDALEELQSRLGGDAKPFNTNNTPSTKTNKPKVNTPAPIVNQPVTTNTQQPREVTIAGGETLRSIAQRDLGDANRFGEIAKLNSIADPDKIQAGAKLKLPTK